MDVDKPKSKKLVYVSEELLDAIIVVSKKKGESVTKFVEDKLRQALQIEQLDNSIEDMAEMLEILQVQKILGGNFVPLEVMNYIFSSQGDAQSKELFKVKWYESGKLYGRYIKERFEDPVKAFRILLCTMRWDLNEVGIRKDSSTINLRCVSTSLTDTGTDLLAKFIEGAMNGIGYKTGKSDCMKGMILFEFVKQ